MATVVSICNLALSRIGDNATISAVGPSDGSFQAEACGRLYPIALGTCLGMHNWAFATRRVRLAAVADTMVDKGEWQHAYAAPADCQRAISVYREESESFRGYPVQAKRIHYTEEEEKIPFEVVGTDYGLVILTNAENAGLLYVCSEPKTSQFSTVFVDALAWLLASYLAGEIIRGESGHADAQNCLKQCDAMVSMAAKMDARQRHNFRDATPTWILSR